MNIKKLTITTVTALAIGIGATSPTKAELTLTGIAIDIAVTAAEMYWTDVGQYIQACNSASRAREGQRVIREAGEALGEQDRLNKSRRLAEWKNASSMNKGCFYALASPQLQRDVARLESALREELPEGYYIDNIGNIYYYNGNGRRCHIPHGVMYAQMGSPSYKNDDRIHNYTLDGHCAAPEGYFNVGEDIYYSNGTGDYCHMTWLPPSWVEYPFKPENMTYSGDCSG